jgi:hypothetical protein
MKVEINSRAIAQHVPQRDFRLTTRRLFDFFPVTVQLLSVLSASVALHAHGRTADGISDRHCRNSTFQFCDSPARKFLTNHVEIRYIVIRR